MKNRIRTIAQHARRIPQLAGEHAFLFVLALLALGGVATALVFYAYVFSVSRANIPGTIETELNQQLFGTVRQELDARGRAFQGVRTADFQDIFEPRLTR